MRSATVLEARTYCDQEEGARKVADDGSIYFEAHDEHCFIIQSPSEYRRLGYLCQHLVSWIYGGQFPGGLIWLRRWDVGAEYLTPMGWKVIEIFVAQTGIRDHLSRHPPSSSAAMKRSMRRCFL